MPELLAFITITLLAVISPGPDFAMVSRNSLVHSRSAGVITAVGIGLGVMVHVSYSIFGIGILVRESVHLLGALKLAGAAYLVYLGLRMLLSKAQPKQEMASRPTDSAMAMLRTGFLTNALNPKTCIFVVSLFVQVIEPGAGVGVQLGYGAFIVLAHVAWFSLVAYFFSAASIRSRLMRVRQRIDQVFGVMLVGFGALLGVKGA
ncbi:MAG: LysE family transporter [Pseudomonas sp.]|uniref:LysE family translocator n=1 Tax=Pseudomonas sp. TaxID=306 RepID=UPI002733830C|nr:LysE family transporter [Pseudomonas sp.]MDP3848033.1 LysE family transporter [Pseudomonas sp.]